MEAAFRRNHVLVITPGGVDGPGGIARMTRYFIRAWPGGSPFRFRVIDSYGHYSQLLMPLFFLLAFLHVLCLLLCCRPCLVHVNCATRLSLWRKAPFILCSCWRRVPTIIHVHGSNFDEYCQSLGSRRRALLRWVFQKADRIIVLGEYRRSTLIATMGIDSPRVCVLPNAVPGRDALVTTPADYRVGCRLLFLGAIGDRKGVGVLLHALAHPSVSSLQWQMVLAGGGDVARFEALADTLRLCDRVEFAGLLGEAGCRELLAEADILVLPSRHEGLPIAILEAMSYGIPVIATPVGSIPEAVVDNVTGLLIPVDDIDALAKAMCYLIADVRSRRDMGARARHLYEASFMIEQYVNRMHGLYADLIAERKSRE
jgi:glycosyltransferase involved in cell wall biosynthesis